MKLSEQVKGELGGVLVIAFLLFLIVSAFYSAGSLIYSMVLEGLDRRERLEVYSEMHNLNAYGVRDIRCIGGYLHYLPEDSRNILRYEPQIDCEPIKPSTTSK